MASVPLPLLADPDRFFAQADCATIKDQRKIRVGKVVIEMHHRPAGLYIKRYNAFSARYSLFSTILSSGARRSLRGASILHAAGILVARPLAAVEVRRWGMLEKSFFLSEEIAAAKTADAYWRENLQTISGTDGFRRRRGFLRRLSGLFRRLHDGRIYHNDLKDFNILVREEPKGQEQLYLLDLEGVRRCRYLSIRRRVKNLVQLHRTLGRFLTLSEKLSLLKSYLEKDSPRREQRSAWVKRILAASGRADRHSFAKRRLQSSAVAGDSGGRVGATNPDNGTGPS